MNTHVILTGNPTKTLKTKYGSALYDILYTILVQNTEFWLFKFNNLMLYRTITCRLTCICNIESNLVVYPPMILNRFLFTRKSKVLPLKQKNIQNCKCCRVWLLIIFTLTYTVVHVSSRTMFHVVPGTMPHFLWWALYMKLRRDSISSL